MTNDNILKKDDYPVDIYHPDSLDSGISVSRQTNKHLNEPGSLHILSKNAAKNKFDILPNSCLHKMEREYNGNKTLDFINPKETFKRIRHDSDKSSTQSSVWSTYTEHDEYSFFRGLLVLKIIFIDIGISLGNHLTDFLQVENNII